MIEELSHHNYDVSVRTVGFENHPVLSKPERTEDEQSDISVKCEQAVYLADNSGPEY